MYALLLATIGGTWLLASLVAAASLTLDLLNERPQ